MADPSDCFKFVNELPKKYHQMNIFDFETAGGEMKMKNLSNFIGKYMAWIVLVIAALAFVPAGNLSQWVQTAWTNYLLMIVMFGMGLTMKLSDFAIVFREPKDVIIGCAAQFLIMPFLAFALSKVFGLSDELLVGVILVGTCPGEHPAMSSHISLKVIRHYLWA